MNNPSSNCFTNIIDELIQAHNDKYTEDYSVLDVFSFIDTLQLTKQEYEIGSYIMANNNRQRSED